MMKYFGIVTRGNCWTGGIPEGPGSGSLLCGEDTLWTEAEGVSSCRRSSFISSFSSQISSLLSWSWFVGLGETLAGGCEFSVSSDINFFAILLELTGVESVIPCSSLLSFFSSWLEFILVISARPLTFKLLAVFNSADNWQYSTWTSPLYMNSTSVRSSAKRTSLRMTMGCRLGWSRNRVWK